MFMTDEMRKTRHLACLAAKGESEDKRMKTSLEILLYKITDCPLQIWFCLQLYNIKSKCKVLHAAGCFSVVQQGLNMKQNILFDF